MKALLPLLLTLAACRSLPAGTHDLLDADRAFCADAQARRIEGWLAAFDEHGSQVADDFTPITGHDALRKSMQQFFADSANVLSWEPETARISEAGNLGTTTGRWMVGRRAADGSLQVLARGRYFDIWRKLPDGSWKLLYDIGDADREH
jgi:ketosteroid isomerase-like protein